MSDSSALYSWVCSCGRHITERVRKNEAVERGACGQKYQYPCPRCSKLHRQIRHSSILFNSIDEFQCGRCGNRLLRRTFHGFRRILCVQLACICAILWLGWMFPTATSTPVISWILGGLFIFAAAGLGIALRVYGNSIWMKNKTRERGWAQRRNGVIDEKTRMW